MLPLRYENPVLIGKGANASVYRAYDKQMQCSVAFKWGLSQLSRHVLFRLRWQQEVFLLQDFISPNIVELCDYGVWKERPYMALRFVEDTLPSALQSPQTVQRRLDWLLQLLDALSTLHLRDVIHQDINPDNILIDGERLLLTDFSVARAKSTIHADVSEVSGTMGWSAPEQQKREHKWINCWTDIFAWGRIAHYLFQGDSAFEFLQDIVAKATAPDCLERFDSVSVLRSILLKRIETIPSSVLLSEKKVKDNIPIPLSIPVPQIEIPIVKRNRLDAPQKGVFGERVRACIRSAYTNVHEFAHPGVVLVRGGTEKEKQEVILEEVDYIHKTYPVRVVSVDYEKFDGILQLVRHWVSPHNESHEETVARIKKNLLCSRNIRAVQKEKEANMLALWSRRNVLAELEVGLLFFIQKIQDYAQDTPVILMMNQPQKSRIDGDGLDLCSLFLSKFFAALPLLVIASVDEEEQKDERLFELAKQGADDVELHPRTLQQFSSRVSKDVALWHKVCSGNIHKWRMIKDEPIQSGDRYIDLVARVFERFEQEAQESTKVFVRGLALSIRPVPLYICRERAEELEEAFRYQILRLDGKWVVFCSSIVQSFLQKRHTEVAARLLGDLWRKAEHEDAQERYISWCRAMSMAGSWSIVRPTLQKTMEQCFLFRRVHLLLEGMELYTQYGRKKSSASKKGCEAFLYAEEGRDIGEWKELFLSCTTEQKQGIVVSFVRKGTAFDPSSELGIYEKDAWWNILMGEAAYVSEDAQRAKRFFQTAVQILEKQSFVRIWSCMRWVEISLHQGEGHDLEDSVLSLLNYSRQLSSVRGMACASFAYGLFCFSQKRFDEGVQRLYHAASTSLICGHWSLWSRVMSYLAARFFGQQRLDMALEVLEYKRTMCMMKNIPCPHIHNELWLVDRQGSIPDSSISSLNGLCLVLHNPTRALWLEHKEKICMTLHPFVPIFLRRLPENVISSLEKEEILHQISLELC